MCPKTQINLRLYKKQTGTVKKLQPISNLETFSSWSCLICIYNVFQLPPATHSKIKQIWNAYWQVKPHWPYCQFYGVNTIQPPPPDLPNTHTCSVPCWSLHSWPSSPSRFCLAAGCRCRRIPRRSGRVWRTWGGSHGSFHWLWTQRKGKVVI